MSSLLAALRSQDSTERKAAIAQLLSLETISTVEIEALVEALGASDRSLQRCAAETVCALAARGVDLESSIAGALSSGSARLRWGAAFASAQSGHPPAAARTVLVGALAEADSDIRWAAAALIAKIADTDLLVPELLAATESSNPVQRRMVLYCLRDLGLRGESIQAAVLAALGDSDRQVRLAALAAAPRCCSEVRACIDGIVAVLGDGDAGIGRAALISLSRIEGFDEIVRPLIEAQLANSDGATRQAVERIWERRRLAGKPG